MSASYLAFLNKDVQDMGDKTISNPEPNNTHTLNASIRNANTNFTMKHLLPNKPVTPETFQSTINEHDCLSDSVDNLSNPEAVEKYKEMLATFTTVKNNNETEEEVDICTNEIMEADNKDQESEHDSSITNGFLVSDNCEAPTNVHPAILAQQIKTTHRVLQGVTKSVYVSLITTDVECIANNRSTTLLQKLEVIDNAVEYLLYKHSLDLHEQMLNVFVKLSKCLQNQSRITVTEMAARFEALWKHTIVDDKYNGLCRLLKTNLVEKAIHMI